MKKIQLFYLKNQMLVANGAASVIGVFLVHILLFSTQAPVAADVLIYPVARWTAALFSPLAFLFVTVATVCYERPIRHFLNCLAADRPIAPNRQLKARQRLLNEPFALMALNLTMWLLAALIWSAIHWAYGSGTRIVLDTLYSNLSVGMITVTVSFFLLEYLLQKKLVAHFFPGGGLSAIPRTLRIRIQTRLMALLFACNLIPLAHIILIVNRLATSPDAPVRQLARLQTAINTNAWMFIGVGICLTVLVSRNLTIPFRDILQTVHRIKKGRFDRRVQVRSNDEIGYTGDAINAMTQGLIERDQMRLSLNLAREVQQKLLPKTAIKINGIDIAGKSVFCDETGGDYYDIIVCGDAAGQKIAVAIGDVSGHGIPSALLMTTVRSALRQRASLPGTPAQIITDVNRQLVMDVEDSGQFMTLFFLVLDPTQRRIQWVRAGHDPAIGYDAGTGAFRELGGPGIALGLDANWVYEQTGATGNAKGRIIFLSTDGIWEARNPNGEMLGKEPIMAAIRQHAASEARHILDAVHDTLSKFVGDGKIEDDITSVVIKM